MWGGSDTARFIEKRERKLVISRWRKEKKKKYFYLFKGKLPHGRRPTDSKEKEVHHDRKRKGQNQGDPREVLRGQKQRNAMSPCGMRRRPVRRKKRSSKFGEKRKKYTLQKRREERKNVK